MTRPLHIITLRDGRLIKMRPATPLGPPERDPWWAYVIVYLCLFAYVVAVGAWLIAGSP